MKFSENTLYQIYKRIIGAVSGINSVGLRLEDNCQPHYNKDNNSIVTFGTVPYARDDEEDYLVGRGILLHEISHVLFAPFIGPTTNGTFNMEWLNVFCDVNNEYKLAEIYPHLKPELARKNNVFIEQNQEVLKTDNPFMQVLLRIDKISTKFKPEYPINYDYKDFVDKVVNRCIVENVWEMSGNKLIDFTIRISEWYDDLKNSFKSTNPTNYKKIKEAMGECIKKGLTKEYKELAKKLRKSNVREGEIKEGPPSELLRHNSFQYEPNYNDLTLDELKKRLSKQTNHSKSKVGGCAWGNASHDLKNYVKTLNLDSKVFDTESDTYNIDFEQPRRDGMIINRALKRRVDLMSSFDDKHKSGRIDINQIRSQIARTGQIINEHIFKRNDKLTRGGQWAIEVLIDCSGSMGCYNKMNNAKKALATLAYALKGLPNVRLGLTGFTQEDDTLDIPIKKLSDNKFDVKKINRLKPLNGNKDGWNIRSAAKRLLKLGNMKKILIVISDGQPAYYNGLEDTKLAVEQCKKFGIKVIGVGIEGSTKKSLESCYPISYQFEQSKDMPRDLIELILQSLNNSNKQTKLVKNKWKK